MIRMAVLVVLLFQLGDKAPASETHSSTCFHKEVRKAFSSSQATVFCFKNVPYERHQYMEPQEKACQLSKKDGQKTDCTSTT